MDFRIVNFKKMMAKNLFELSWSPWYSHETTTKKGIHYLPIKTNSWRSSHNSTLNH
jgi:hypothetical protein